MTGEDDDVDIHRRASFLPGGISKTITEGHAAGKCDYVTPYRPAVTRRSASGDGRTAGGQVIRAISASRLS